MQKLSRAKLELLFECPRCFWFYAGKAVARPSGAPYTINSAIDALLKQEFDLHRQDQTAHRLIREAGIDAIPFSHPDIDRWRTNFTGVQHHHEDTDFLVTGAVDDVWQDSNGNLLVVDYKASGAKEGALYSSYKRQMEVYQWLLRRNGFSVLNRGYFVYCRVNKDDGFAQGLLKFDIKVQPYDGDDSWVEARLREAREVLDGPLPAPSQECKHCQYVQKRSDLGEEPPIFSSTAQEEFSF